MGYVICLTLIFFLNREIVKGGKRGTIKVYSKRRKSDKFTFSLIGV